MTQHENYSDLCWHGNWVTGAECRQIYSVTVNAFKSLNYWVGKRNGIRKYCKKSMHRSSLVSLSLTAACHFMSQLQSGSQV